AATMGKKIVEYLARDTAGLAIDLPDDGYRRLMHASLYRKGIAIELTIDAIEAALLASTDRLELDHFKSAFEKRTGCRPKDNVFAVDTFEYVNVQSVLYPENAGA